MQEVVAFCCKNQFSVQTATNCNKIEPPRCWQIDYNAFHTLYILKKYSDQHNTNRYTFV